MHSGVAQVMVSMTFRERAHGEGAAAAAGPTITEANVPKGGTTSKCYPT